VLAKGINWRIAGLDKVFSSEAQIHFILVIYSFEGDIYHLKTPKTKIILG
jgi:hypothetical protein